MADASKVRTIIVLATAYYFELLGERLEYWGLMGVRQSDVPVRPLRAAHQLIHEGLVAMTYRALGDPRRYAVHPRLESRSLLVKYGHFTGIKDASPAARWHDLLVKFFHLSACTHALLAPGAERPPAELLHDAATLARGVSMFIKRALSLQAAMGDCIGGPEPDPVE